ncbi:MAG: M20 family metallopeptidase [Thermoleophilia bacterium]|nr:M20 family metallopeptidase [Gaiellaceae bacterium]MDW8338227.1 M20 family metallopeptidase [Thermoleophilia bacterium]
MSVVDVAVATDLARWLRAREEEMADLLVRLVSIETPSTVPDAHGPALELLASELRSCGLQARRVRGARTGGLLYARPRERERGRPLQLVVGHVDTVWPLGSVEELGVEAGNGVVRGPGAFDMKGGLVELVFALRALAEHELVPEVTPVCLVNTDEEIGSIESRAHLERLARRAVRAYVLEPAYGPSGRLKTARKSAGHFRVVVRGRAAHAGVNPEEGASAILELSHQIQRLFALNDPRRGITVNVGMIDGGLGANVIAPEASAEVDVRVPTLEDARRIEAELESLEPVGEGVTVEVEGRFGRLPMEATARNRALWRAAKAAGAQLGLELEEAAVGGASDGNITSLYTATLDGLGPIGGRAHAPGEHVLLASLPERAALLAVLLLLPAEAAA